MPARLFFELHSEKQNRITEAALKEFAEYGYEGSSTNRIVKSAGISKGSLFQYFSNKEELYFYILDQVTEKYITDLEQTGKSLSPELSTRVTEYALAEFTWYIQHPESGRLIISAFTNYNSCLYSKILARYKIQKGVMFDTLLDDIDTSQFLWEKSKTIQLLKWVLTGFNKDFVNELKDNSGMDLEAIKNKYAETLTEYLILLKTGILRKE